MQQLYLPASTLIPSVSLLNSGYQKIKQLFKSNDCLTLRPESKETEMEYSDKQLQIIEVAERLFATNGFHASSVRDIAKEADVNIAMISYYFGSKEKLLEAVFAVRTAELKALLANLVDDTKLTPLEKIYKLIDAYMDKIMRQQFFHKIMVREQISQRDSNCVVNTLIKETKQKNYQLISQIIGQGQKQGVFRKNIDVHFMMLTMMGTTNQLISTQHYYREMNNMTDMPDEEFQKHLKKKLSLHLKSLFKALLTINE